ncbi:MAG: hypothetical protein WC749_08615 [Dehalococcoidia bacterium]
MAFMVASAKGIGEILDRLISIKEASEKILRTFLVGLAGQSPFIARCTI